MSYQNPNPKETPQQKQTRWNAGCRKARLDRLAKPEYTDIKYVCTKEDQLGYVDFDDDYFADPVYQSYDGRRKYTNDATRMVLEDGQQSVQEKIAELLHFHHANEDEDVANHETFNDQDLNDLRLIGIELCQWSRSNPLLNMESKWTSLVHKAARHYKAGTNPEDYETYWPAIVALYLKMDDISLLG